MIDALAGLGYRRFKIINQVTHTQSTPIYEVPGGTILAVVAEASDRGAGTPLAPAAGANRV